MSFPVPPASRWRAPPSSCEESSITQASFATARAPSDFNKWQMSARSGNKVAVVVWKRGCGTINDQRGKTWLSPERGGRAGRREMVEPRLTASHFSTRRRAPGCQADKVKHCRDPSWMARPFMQFNDFINLMSQMLVSWVPVICHLS